MGAPRGNGRGWIPSALPAKAMSSSLRFDADEAKAVDDCMMVDLEKELGVADHGCDVEEVEGGGRGLSLSGCGMEYEGLNEELPEPSLDCGAGMLMHVHAASQQMEDDNNVAGADMPIWEDMEGGGGEEEDDEAGMVNGEDLEMVDMSTMGVGADVDAPLAPEKCAICGDGSLDATVDCGNDHQFCFACIYQWVFDGEPFTTNQPVTKKNTCPLCR